MFVKELEGKTSSRLFRALRASLSVEPGLQAGRAGHCGEMVTAERSSSVICDEGAVSRNGTY
jgi:hypothetical protein